MSKLVLVNTKIITGGYDISGTLNATTLDYSADTPECSAFGNDTHIMAAGGLKNATVAHEGYWDTALDSQLFSDVGVADVPFMVIPEGGTVEGTVAYFMRATESQYTIGGAIGEVLPVSIQGVASDSPLVRGILVYSGTASSSSTTTGTQLGAISSTQVGYAALSVQATTGSGAFTIESDDNSGFTTATSRIAFSNNGSAVGSEWNSVAGAITDDYWRLNYTISSGSITFTVVLGII